MGELGELGGGLEVLVEVGLDGGEVVVGVVLGRGEEG